MTRKYSSYIMGGVMSMILILILSLNVMAAHDGKIPYTTDKSDRTMLKEILMNQRKTHILLGEVKGLLQEAR